MKIQWVDGGMMFRPTNHSDHHYLLKMFTGMGGLDADGNPRTLWITPEYPGEGEAPKDNRLNGYDPNS